MTMNRTASAIGISLLSIWLVAHLLYLGPVENATEVALTWFAGVAAASAIIAALTVLVWGVARGQHSHAWLRFVAQARTTGAVLGVMLALLGLLHWRDTEPRGETHWLILGLVVLAGAGLVQMWLAFSSRRHLG
jgi:hypothetical protein